MRTKLDGLWLWWDFGGEALELLCFGLKPGAMRRVPPLADWLMLLPVDVVLCSGPLLSNRRSLVCSLLFTGCYQVGDAPLHGHDVLLSSVAFWMSRQLATPARNPLFPAKILSVVRYGSWDKLGRIPERLRCLGYTREENRLRLRKTCVVCDQAT